MIFPGFSAPAAAWLALLFVPLVLFYFLKLKRPRLEIPSLVLWRQVLNDQRVNSPFQRFKRNLLLLLQLLLLLFLVLAATQPFLRRPDAARAHRRLLLLDCSASMAAREDNGRPGGGSTRLELAKTRARALIDHLLPGQELALVSFAGTARRRADFTADARTLRDALAAVEVEDVPGDLGEALRLAGALARGAPFDAALLLSDGNFPARVAFDLAFHLDFERLPPAGPNLGITALSARRAAAGGSSGGEWEIFVEVAGSRGADWTGARLELRRDGQVLAEAPLVRPGRADPGVTDPPLPESEPAPSGAPLAPASGGAARQLFRLPLADEASVLEIRLLPAGFDSLAADNAAFLPLPAQRPLRVLVPPSLPAWRRALTAQPGVTLDLRDAPPSESALPFDLVLTDRLEELRALPDARTICTVGCVPPDLSALVEIAPVADGGGATVIDWHRDADALRHVELGDLVLLDAPVARAGATDADFANLGYEILAHGARGPLVLERRAGPARREIALLFSTDRSTLPYRVGFPVLVANLVGIAARTAGLSEAAAPRTGPGAPRVGAASTTHDWASLLSPLETSLVTVENIRFNEQLTTAAVTLPARSERPLWQPLALGAFALLLVEWWAFQHRPRGGAISRSSLHQTCGRRMATSGRAGKILAAQPPD